MTKRGSVRRGVKLRVKWDYLMIISEWWQIINRKLRFGGNLSITVNLVAFYQSPATKVAFYQFSRNEGITFMLCSSCWVDMAHEDQAFYGAAHGAYGGPPTYEEDKRRYFLWFLLAGLGAQELNL